MAAVIELKPAGQSATVASAQKSYIKGDYAQAGAIAELYLREHPDDAQALAILSAVYKQADRLALAYFLGKRASELRPDRPETWVCHGFAAQSLWRMDEALSCYRKALQRAQGGAQKALYNNNIASAYLDLGKFAEAEKYVDASLALDPNEKNTRHNKGLCLLARREWGEAWNWYSASIGSNQRTEFRYMKGTPQGAEPCWDGKPFAGILAVYGEQGLGDEVCAASAIPDIIAAQKSAGGRVIIDCDKRLEGLFRRSFPEATVHGTRWEKALNWPEEDRNVGASIACFEVLKHFRTKAEDFPGKPYLKPCPDRVKQWKATFDNGKPTIGVAWTGGTWKNAGSYRQLPLAQWGPIFDAVDANWVSLQHKDASADIAGTPVKQYPWGTLGKDYDDTAALVASCDLVLGMQTSVHHLAGGLGVPSWIMLPTTSQWRYGEEYEDLPWYQNTRLYRQKGDTWPISRIVDDLKGKFA
jgi:tetratricopeptide (TPR) repeat protein